MLIKTLCLKDINAAAEIYDDCADPAAGLDNDALSKILFSDPQWLKKQKEKAQILKSNYPGCLKQK